MANVLSLRSLNRLPTANPAGMAQITQAQPGVPYNPIVNTAVPTAMPTGAPQPANSALPTAQLNPLQLPRLDGSQYVATGGMPAGADPATTARNLASQFSYSGGDVAGTVKNLASQFAYSPGSDPAQAAAAIAAQFNTTPDQLPAEIVQEINNTFAQAQRASASETAMGAMNDLLSNEGSYITNARRRGLEAANSRGLLNSSMAAGISQRSALDAAQPIFSEIMGLNNQREAQDFNAMMQSRNQTFDLTSNRENKQFQRDMAGMQMAGQFAGMDRQAVIDHAQQQLALAGQLEGQAREAALAQSRDAFSAAQAMEMQRSQNGFAGAQASLDRTQSVNNALLSGELNERQMGLGSYYDQQQAILGAGLNQQLQSDATAQQDWLTGRQMEQGNFYNQQQATLDANLKSQLQRDATAQQDWLTGRQMDQANYNAQQQAILDADLRQQLQSDATTQQDWLSDRQFNREFNAALSTMAIGGAMDLNKSIMDYAAQNPEVYSPEIISGMTNFFQMNMTGLLQQYFPDLMGGNGS